MDCIFCKIINKEIPSAVLYEDSNFLVLLDAFPTARGHTLIISKEHVTDLFSLDDNTSRALMPLAKKIGEALKKALNCDGINIVQNNGKAAGQTVFHFHLHLIPRFEEDEPPIRFNSKPCDAKELKSLCDVIANSINQI